MNRQPRFPIGVTHGLHCVLAAVMTALCSHAHAVHGAHGTLMRYVGEPHSSVVYTNVRRPAENGVRIVSGLSEAPVAASRSARSASAAASVTATEFPVISAAVQRERDIDRYRIVEVELQAAKLALQRDAARQAPAPILTRDQGDIAALHRELARTRRAIAGTAPNVWPAY